MWMTVGDQRFAIRLADTAAGRAFAAQLPLTLDMRDLNRNEKYAELTGSTNEVQIRAPWMRSMRDERDLHRPRTVLDVVMVLSVGTAVTLFGIWFMFFAEGGGI